MQTVLVLGGYGFFGQRIGAALASGPSLRVLLAGRRPPSLRCYLRRHGDPVGRSIPKRMRLEVGLCKPRHIGGPDRISERLLIASYWIGGGLQVDPVAMGARHPRGMLKACIELVRSCRLTEIESLCAHVNGNNDLMILGRNVAGEERARNCGGAKDPRGTHASCFGVHMKFLRNLR